MKKIWKYEISLREREKSFKMPRESRIVHVACQRPDIVTFWAVVGIYLGTELETRTFRIFATGSEIPDEYNYSI